MVFAEPRWRLLERLRRYLHSGTPPARVMLTMYRAVRLQYRVHVSFLWHRRFRHNLTILYDAMAETEMRDKYWIVGGLLLGWARAGAVIKYDRDADFGFLKVDQPLFLNAMPRLVAAGFRPLLRWKNNAGKVTEYCFIKDDTRFEFFVFDQTNEGLEYSLYGRSLECRCVLPLHGLEPMHFLGRTWQKPTDHEAYLAAMYGDWRVPDPNFNYLDDEKTIRDRYPWHGTNVWPADEVGAP